MCPGKKINNLEFLNGQGELVNLLQGLDLHVLGQAVRLGDKDPVPALEILAGLLR